MALDTACFRFCAKPEIDRVTGSLRQRGVRRGPPGGGRDSIRAAGCSRSRLQAARTLHNRPSPCGLTFAHQSVEACRGGDGGLAAPEGGRAGRSPAPALSEAEWGDRRKPWDPAASGPEPGRGRFLRRWLAGCRGANRPLRGLCTGGRPFPGFPSVTLGYGPDAPGKAEPEEVWTRCSGPDQVRNRAHPVGVSWERRSALVPTLRVGTTDPAAPRLDGGRAFFAGCRGAAVCAPPRRSGGTSKNGRGAPMPERVGVGPLTPALSRWERESSRPLLGSCCGAPVPAASAQDRLKMALDTACFRFCAKPEIDRVTGSLRQRGVRRGPPEDGTRYGLFPVLRETGNRSGYRKPAPTRRQARTAWRRQGLHTGSRLFAVAASGGSDSPQQALSLRADLCPPVGRGVSRRRRRSCSPRRGASGP